MINGMILIVKLLIFRSLMAMSLDVPLMVNTYLNLFALPDHLRMLLTSIIVTNSSLPNFLSKTIGIINSAKHFQNFIVVEKYHVSLKKLMQQGICNPEFYGHLVYKFKKIIGNPNFSNLFKRIVNRFKRAGYTLDIKRQTACLVFNPIMVEGYAALFSCTAVVQASDSMTASM